MTSRPLDAGDLASVAAAHDATATAGAAGVVWAVLGPARLHYTLATGEVTSKTGAGRYAAQQFPAWAELAARAVSYRAGQPMEFMTTDALAAAAMVDAVVEEAWRHWGGAVCQKGNRGDVGDLAATLSACLSRSTATTTPTRASRSTMISSTRGDRDRDFYLNLVLSAESVLDVGCGTGRVLRQARAVGHTGRLAGLDPAAAMLDQAKACTDVDWILGDLGTVSFDHEFELVIMTGHVSQVFLTDEEIAAALAAVRAALADGSRFAFETFNPRLRPWEKWTNQVEVVAADGAVVSAANTNPRLVDRGIVEVVGKFSSPSWEREVLCPGRFRFVEVEELDAFLSEAGLAVMERYGLWDRRPFTDELPEIITIATGV